MKSIKKDSRLVVRIEERTMEELKHLAELNKREFSDYVRRKLEEIIEIEKAKNK